MDCLPKFLYTLVYNLEHTVWTADCHRDFVGDLGFAAEIRAAIVSWHRHSAGRNLLNKLISKKLSMKNKRPVDDAAGATAIGDLRPLALTPLWATDQPRLDVAKCGTSIPTLNGRILR
jgi:hypothetical protein